MVDNAPQNVPYALVATLSRVHRAGYAIPRFPMTILKNPRHEMFAQGLASGKSAADAYVAAGFKANRGNATTLKQQQSISNRVAELHGEREAIASQAVERAIIEAGISKEWVISRLRENVERAMQAEPVLDNKGEPTGEYRYDGAVANRALELLGKELRMFIDRRESGRPGDFSQMTDAELADIARRPRAGGGRNSAEAPSQAESRKLH